MVDCVRLTWTLSLTTGPSPSSPSITSDIVITTMWAEERGREGGREGGRQGGREGGREAGREGGK